MLKKMKNNPLKIYRERYITKANFSNSDSNFLSGTFSILPPSAESAWSPRDTKKFFFTEKPLKKYKKTPYYLFEEK